jgi:hypothetical protein
MVTSELDREIHEKRLQLKEAFAACQKAREAVAHAQQQFAGVTQETLKDAQAELQRLECEERDTANRFRAISDELAQLHRGKYGEWHITWGGPRPSR